MSAPPTEDMEAIAAKAARAAVLEMFIALGVNARDPEAILKMQKDFAYIRVWRESMDTVKRQSLRTAVVVVVTGLVGWVIAAFTMRGH